MSREISDFTPYAHAQSSILLAKYAEKTDDQGLVFGVQVSVSGQVWVRVRKRKIIEV